MDVGVSIGPYVERVSGLSETFAFAEVAIGEGDVPLDEVDPDRLRRDAAANDLDLAVHLPFRQPLATGIEPIDGGTRAYLEDALSVAASLDADAAILHATARETGDGRAREALPRVVRDVVAAGKRRDVRVCLENVGNVGGIALDELGALAERADAPLCLDVGHAYEEAGQEELESFARNHRDRISHVHAHDVRNRGDSHIPVGSGEIDFERVGDALGDADATVTVEVFTDDLEHLESSARRVREAFDGRSG